MYLMIDNFDSFTYNLVQLFGVLGIEMCVYRNDAIDTDRIDGLAPEAIVLSPGPCTPNEAGVCLDVVCRFVGKIPMLGVCLGHQSIIQALGGKIGRASRVVHGKTSAISHDDLGIFAGVSNPFEATRYHSLSARQSELPDSLEVSAHSEDDGEVMAIRHREALCVGVQFHPESVLTTAGPSIMANFAQLVKVHRAEGRRPQC